MHFKTTNKSWNRLLAVGYSATFILLIYLFSFTGAYAQLPANFQKERVSSEFELPTSMAFLPDGQLLIVQQTGEILICTPSEALPVVPSAYMTITNIHTSGEHGLIDITLDPDFSNNGYFYVYYTQNYSQKKKKNSINTVSRFTHNFGTNTASLSSELILWENPLSNASCCHMGGSLLFGADGKLYLTTGEDFDKSMSQDLTRAGGKVLRFNKDGSIPGDNPFVGDPNALPEIYAYGLRNPFRASFDPVSKEIYIAEVGGNYQDRAWEDIHLVKKAVNYGWPDCGDGSSGRNGDGSCTDPAYSDPIFSYPHNGSAASVTGGMRYRGNMFPSEFKGAYFYADYKRNWMRYLTFDSQNKVTGSHEFDAGAGLVVKIMEGPEGAVYFLDIDSGELSRYTYNDGNQPPTIEQASADVNQGASPLTVKFSVNATDSEGDPLSYAWAFGDGNTSNEKNPSHTYHNKGTFTATVKVSDGPNTVTSAPIYIRVGSPPAASVNSPADGSLFRGGDVIQCRATASDSDGSLSEDSYRWTFTFYHNGVEHPRFEPVTGSQASFTVPVNNHVDFSGTTGYIVYLEVTDEDGLKTKKSVQIWPEKVNLTLATEPSGLQLTMDDVPVTGPFTLDALVNFEHKIGVYNAVQCLNGKEYKFAGWSDGGAETHTITTPEKNTTYTATFTQQGECEASCNALAMDGSNKLSLSNAVVLSGDFTIEYWANLSSGITNADAPVSGGSNQYINYYNAQARIFSNGASGGHDPIIASHKTQPDVWTHYAFVRQGSSMKVYINGAEDTGAKATGQWTGDFTINNLGEGAGYLKGQLDELRVWNGARSSSAIAGNYQSSIAANTSGLAAYFDFNETSGVVKDKSGGGHDSQSLPSGISRTASTSPVNCGGGSETNQPPVVNAGSDKAITLPTNTASFTASASDEDGSIASFSWTKESGPTASMDGINTATLSLSGLVEGSYTFKVTVADNKGATASDQVMLTVNDTGNSSCNALAMDGSNKLSLSNAVVLSGDFTIEYWAKLSSGITNADAPVSGGSNQYINYYNAQARIFSNGASGGHDPIIASHKTQPDVWTHYAFVRQGSSMKIYINGAEDTGAKATGQWTGDFTINNLGEGAGYLKGQLDELRVWNGARSSSAIAGNYQSSIAANTSGLAAYFDFNEASGVVKDKSGGGHDSQNLPSGISRTASTSPVNCGGGSETNQPPVVNAGSDKAITLPTNTASFTASASDEDGSIASWKWEKVSGPAATMSGATTATLSLSALLEGSYTFKVAVTDNDGATASDQVMLTVHPESGGNQVPVVSAGSDKTLTLPNNSINLSGIAYDSDGRFVAFSWQKVSGPSVTMSGQQTANVKLSQLVEGVYVFSFSATDNGGATGTDEMTLTVKAAGATQASTAMARTSTANSINISAYPNTFKESLHIKVDAEEPEQFRIKLYTLSGREVYQGSFIPGLANDNLHNIDLSNSSLKQGVYLVYIENKSQSFRKTIRVIKAL